MQFSGRAHSSRVHAHTLICMVMAAVFTIGKEPRYGKNRVVSSRTPHTPDKKILAYVMAPGRHLLSEKSQLKETQKLYRM